MVERNLYLKEEDVEKLQKLNISDELLISNKIYSLTILAEKNFSSQLIIKSESQINTFKDLINMLTIE